MTEVTGNVWNIVRPGEYVCVLVNGSTDRHGHAVMGAGIARQASSKFPGLSKVLGDKIRRIGNHVHVFPEWCLIAFPTKNVYWQDSSVELIERSCAELSVAIRAYGIPVCYLPRPGCGMGRLNWDDVKPVVEKHLSNVVVVSY
jgi:hypothetical protein